VTLDLKMEFRRGRVKCLTRWTNVLHHKALTFASSIDETRDVIDLLIYYRQTVHQNIRDRLALCYESTSFLK